MFGAAPDMRLEIGEERHGGALGWIAGQQVFLLRNVADMEAVPGPVMQHAGRDAVVAAMDRDVHDLRVDGVGLRKGNRRLRRSEVEPEGVSDFAHYGSTLAGDKALAGDASLAAAILDIKRLRRHAHQIAGIDRAERVVVVRVLGLPDELGGHNLRMRCIRSTRQAKVMLNDLQELIAGYFLG